MYVYIYDDYLNKNRYNKAVNRMEIRLTDLGLNGKIIRLGNIKNIKAAVQNEIRLGAKTIIAVGNNQTVNKIMGAIIEADVYSDFQKNTLLGIIPIGGDNSIAVFFGIKNEEEACNILLARRVKKIDLGLIGDYYFLNETETESKGTKINLKGYSLETQEKGVIKIINLLNRGDILDSNPRDGLLDILINTKKRDQSLLHLEKFELTGNNDIIVDGVITVKMPVEISVAKGKLNVIVGKNRSFQ
jgi:diacylglycerol kinase family enzyme